MNKKISFLPIPIILISILFLSAACAQVPEETAVDPTQTRSAATSQSTTSSTITEEPDTTSEELGNIAEVAAARTPIPTPTPSNLDIAVTEFAKRLGLTEVMFLGLSGEDWLNTALAILSVFLIYSVGRFLLLFVLRRVARRTTTEFDDAFLDEIDQQLNWLAIVFALQVGSRRLVFISIGLQTLLNDLFFVGYLSISFFTMFRLVGFGLDWYRDTTDIEMDPNQLDAVLTLIRRLINALLAVIYATILLDNFGISIAAVTAALGIGGLALSLAAQDTLADAISGIIILVDRPFRIGDRIEIDSMDTWGDVTEIGLRTTRIRTRDNRLVIIPNSKIGNNAVTNFTFPDPRYRIQIEIGIGYGQDIDKVRGIIIDAVSQIDGILPDKPVDALFLELAPDNMIFRVRWWIDSYVDTRRMFDKVNQAMYEALEEAGIEMPFTTYDVNIKMDQNNAERIGQAIRGNGSQKKG
ncbi:MAG: mechanosensitive ion channel [Anaerolineales bacterium]|nr:mechanosensitive ion channel [Anaerolineales bacterium]